MPAFPSIEVWREMTNVDERLFGVIRSRSKEFNALDSAFESYAKVRGTKDLAGLSIALEYQNLKNAYEVYVAKKEANNSNWHLFGSTDSNEKFGALTSLKQFLSGYPTAELTPSEERDCLNFTFEKAMRARTALAEATIQLKESESFFKKASDTLRYLKTGEKGKTLSARLQQGKEEAEQKRSSNAQGYAKAAIAKEFYDQANETLSTVQDAVDGVVKPSLASEVQNIARGGQQTISGFEEMVSKALGVTRDQVFSAMINEAQRVLGEQAYAEIVNFIPVLNTISAGGNLLWSLKATFDAYGTDQYCNMVRRSGIVAAGMSSDSIEQLNKLLREDFLLATQATGESAAQFGAGFDPTGTAGSVVGAALAVVHLIQGLVTFGKNYYQVHNANQILAKWRQIPLDGDMSISFGLKSASVDSANTDKLKARRAIGGTSNQSTSFIEAMNECPLLACYFIANTVTIDLLDIVTADQIINNKRSAFFESFQKFNSEKIEALKALAKEKLDSSRFMVVQNKAKAHELRVQAEADNLDRHQKFSDNRKALLESFTNKHIAIVDFRAKAKVATQSAMVFILKRRDEEEARRAAILRELCEAAEKAETHKLIARRQAIEGAIAKYIQETSGFAVLYTARTPEATAAREQLGELLGKGTAKPTLVALDRLTTYLLTIKDAPDEYKHLKPLKKESRLKRLLKEGYDKAP